MRLFNKFPVGQFKLRPPPEHRQMRLEPIKSLIEEHYGSREAALKAVKELMDA